MRLLRRAFSALLLPLGPRHHRPSSNLVVCVTREQCLSVGTPRQTDTFRLSALLSLLYVVRLQLINLALLLQIEDRNARRRGSAQPIPVW